VNWHHPLSSLKRSLRARRNPTLREEFLCPRRREGGSIPFNFPKVDQWETDPEGMLRCSWCGSLHPQLFMALVAVGEEVGPTDKSYKLYIKDHLKFYTQHFGDFDKEYGDAFIDAYLKGEIRWGYPGYPYVRLSIPHTEGAGERLNEAARREAAEGDASHS
jgi:hypothetical protein